MYSCDHFFSHKIRTLIRKGFWAIRTTIIINNRFCLNKKKNDGKSNLRPAVCMYFSMYSFACPYKCMFVVYINMKKIF